MTTPTSYQLIPGSPPTIALYLTLDGQKHKFNPKLDCTGYEAARLGEFWFSLSTMGSISYTTKQHTDFLKLHGLTRHFELA